MKTSKSCDSSLRRIDRMATTRGRLLFTVALLLALQGCALTPRGLTDERAALDAAGAAFRRGSDPAELPTPVNGDDWRSLLRRALLANGDVHAAWFEWKAAVERVSGASSWPNTNMALGYSYLFSDQNVKSFDRMSFDAGFAPNENLSYPGKTMAAGRVALADAQAAGERFRAAKFSVQRQVLVAWLDLALAAEQARLARENLTLAGIAGDAADAALEAGADQGLALGAEIATAKRLNELQTATARIAQSRALLAGLTATEAATDIKVPTRLPRPRALPTNLAVLLAAASAGPVLQGLEADRSAREHEANLAKLEWVPDINPYAAVTGSIEQGVGAMVMLPTTIIEIRSGIAVAKAMRRAAVARLAQADREQVEMVRTGLIAAADAERAHNLLAERILPAAASASLAAESAYTTGQTELGPLVETRALVIDARMELAASAIERERQLSLVEEILGVDLETFTNQGAMRVFADAAPATDVAPTTRGARLRADDVSAPSNSAHTGPPALADSILAGSTRNPETLR